MPFFSIIIPTYNRACIIRRPIDSIIAQTFTDWELIIVDDGSTDHTQEIVDSYNDSRIKYIWQENQERSAARNHGITLATGIWLCFQDSDDEYLPEHLQVLFEGIQAFPEYKIIRTGLHIYENERYIGKSGIESMNKYDQFPYDSIQVFTFHSSILEYNQFEVNYFNAEDLHFLLKIGLNNALKIINQLTGIHHYDPKSSGGVGFNYEKNLTNRRACLEDILVWNNFLILPSLRRKRCLIEILILYGHIKYKPENILSSLLENLKILCRFPIEYVKLILKIIYVKIGEFSGFYRTLDRF
jgi:glycosyltransferase involved in cell wall biosynthesis